MADAPSTRTFQLRDRAVRRMGYGAMQLAVPEVFGSPKDRAQAVAVLREAVASGVNHIDTSEFYEPHVTNQVIREALHPFPTTSPSSPRSARGAAEMRPGTPPIQVAIAWLLCRAPNVLLIPSTSSVARLRENLAAAEPILPDDAMTEEAIGAAA